MLTIIACHAAKTAQSRLWTGSANAACAARFANIRCNGIAEAGSDDCKADFSDIRCSCSKVAFRSLYYDKNGRFRGDRNIWVLSIPTACGSHRPSNIASCMRLPGSGQRQGVGALSVRVQMRAGQRKLRQMKVKPYNFFRGACALASLFVRNNSQDTAARPPGVDGQTGAPHPIDSGPCSLAGAIFRFQPSQFTLETLRRFLAQLINSAKSWVVSMRANPLAGDSGGTMWLLCLD